MLKVAFLALGPALGTPVFAQTDTNQATAADVNTQYDADTRTGDMEGIISIIAPPTPDIVSASFGEEIANLRRTMAAQTGPLTAQVEVDGFAVNIDGARGGITPNGRPFFVMETRMTMAVIGAGRVRAISDRLAFEDGDDWWHPRVENAYHRQLLARAYPDLAGIEFTTGTLEDIQ